MLELLRELMEGDCAGVRVKVARVQELLVTAKVRTYLITRFPILVSYHPIILSTHR